MQMIKDNLVGALRYLTQDYIRDVRKLGDDGMAADLGGKARRAYDYSYEVAYVGRRIAKRLRLEEPAPWPWAEGYAVAPAEFASVDALCAELEAAAEETCAAIMDMPDDRWTHEFPFGPDFKITAFQLAVHAIDHLTYHQGQLNQLQMIRGDDSMD